MKRFVSLILVLMLILALAACGGEPDPNAGLYEATTAEYAGFSLEVSSLYESGLSLELKDGGRAILTMDGTDYSVKWSLEGEALTITAADIELSGTLSDGSMVLDMGEGVSVTFSKTN